jgi:hypothetical protein
MVLQAHQTLFNDSMITNINPMLCDDFALAGQSSNLG